jgi:transcriptional regulator with XRE-family HTH domain
VPRKSAEPVDPELLRTIGGRFRKARDDAGFTLEWIEKKTGVPRTSIGRFETGKRGIESSGFMAVLHAAAERGVDLNYVFTGLRSGARAAEVRKAIDAAFDDIQGLTAKHRSGSGR